jgi:serine protease Do
VAETRPGASVRLEVVRKGQARTLNAVVGEARDPRVAQQEQAQPRVAGSDWRCEPLQRDERRDTGIAHGLVVEQASGAAARAGLRRAM